MEDARVRRWQRISELALEAAELRELRAAITSVCAAPGDPIVREALRALTRAGALQDQVVPLLTVEARAKHPPVVVAALRDEVQYACKHIERPAQRLAALEEIAKLEPGNPDHLERLAWTYYLVGAWVQAAQTLELLAAQLATDHALVILRAAGRLFRNSGRKDRALVAYRAVAVRRPSDHSALIPLSELMLAPDNEPNSPFDPKVEQPVPAAAPPRQAPKHTQTRSTASPVPTPAPVRTKEPTTPVARTNAQAADDAVDLFASLDDDEMEASLAFAFGDGVVAPPPPQRKKPSRQTQERDGVLRPPALASTPALPLPDLDNLDLDDAPVAPEVARMIDAARRDADAGDIGSAERLLRALLRTRPDEIAGQLALVELLQGNDRLEDADVFLRGALATPPLDAGNHHALLRQHALVTAALARLATDDARRRALAEEAIAAYETIGDSDSADELAIWLHRPIRQSR